VQFILRRDAEGVFQFASLQGELAGRILAHHGADAGDLDTLYVLVDCDHEDEELLAGSDAVIFILQQLAAAEPRSAYPGRRPGSTEATPTRELWFWRLVAAMLQLVPRALREWGYRMVARNRYRMFGRYDACPVPTEEIRRRFLDLG
jgi:predicted DCC family thiol-disulfide oxidoreductase YuxK